MRDLGGSNEFIEQFLLISHGPTRKTGDPLHSLVTPNIFTVEDNTTMYVKRVARILEHSALARRRPGFDIHRYGFHSRLVLLLFSCGCAGRSLVECLPYASVPGSSPVHRSTPGTSLSCFEPKKPHLHQTLP